MPNRETGVDFWFEKYPAVEGFGSHVSADYSTLDAVIDCWCDDDRY